MHPQDVKKLDGIDAAIFTGRPDAEDRKELRRLFARWERRLVEIEEMDAALALEDLAQ